MLITTKETSSRMNKKKKLRKLDSSPYILVWEEETHVSGRLGFASPRIISRITPYSSLKEAQKRLDEVKDRISCRFSKIYTQSEFASKEDQNNEKGS